MDLLIQRRRTLTDDQREMLNAIWEHYKEKGHWITRKRLHHLFRDRLQVNEVRAALERLGGKVVFETMDDQKECYALTFMGMLITDHVTAGVKMALARFWWWPRAHAPNQRRSGGDHSSVTVPQAAPHGSISSV